MANLSDKTVEILEKFGEYLQTFELMEMYDNICLRAQVEPWVQDYVYIMPLMVIFPLLANIFVLVVFKKANILGATQKMVVFCMLVDNLFVIGWSSFLFVLALRDELFGFIAYRVCPYFFICIGFLNFILGSSLWLKAFMTFERVLVLGFPLLVVKKNFKFYRIVTCFFIVHTLFSCTIYISYNLLLQFRPIPVVQMFRPGRGFKIMNCCVVETSIIPIDINEIFEIFFTVFQIVYLSVIPNVLILVSAVILLYQVQSHLKVLSRCRVSTEMYKIPYLMICRVTIILAVGYLLQQTPFYFTWLAWQNQGVAKIMNSSWYVIYSIICCFAKPIEFFFYLSVSKRFRKTLKNMACCSRKS